MGSCPDTDIDPIFHLRVLLSERSGLALLNGPILFCLRTFFLLVKSSSKAQAKLITLLTASQMSRTCHVKNYHWKHYKK